VCPPVVLQAADIAHARALAVTATAASKAERAWLQEFDAGFICDAVEGLADAMQRSIRQTL
jgi:hypothetical protein